MPSQPRRRSLALILACTLAIGPVLAAPPPWAEGGGKPQGQDQWQPPNRHGKAAKHSRYFDTHHREVVRSYFDEQFRAGGCPPGLAKKHNGCLPPGQAKKWALGYRLPSDVTYYPLPPDLVVQLGPPPQGERYVRVASDILLVTIGSMIVLDAIQDMGR